MGVIRFVNGLLLAMALSSPVTMALPADFASIPSSLTLPKPFVVRHSAADLADFRTLLNLSKIGPETFWSQQTDGQFGISRDWFVNAKTTWLNDFDWRQHEARINSFPNFKVSVNDAVHGQVQMHFMGLFSKNPRATPLLLLHGWPGSVLEFLPIIRLLSTKYTPHTLPYHVIVPSLPGYGYSPVFTPGKELAFEDAGRILNTMMVNLGFGNGYVSHGGDVGSMLSAYLLGNTTQCKAAHINLLSSPVAVDLSDPVLTPADVTRLQGVATFSATGFGYSIEQGTRPATIGLALSTSPLALLAWIGEKVREWAGVPIPLDDLLADVTLYWLTSTYPSSIYPYRFTLTHANPFQTSLTKPLGYSNFPDEILFVPQGIAAREFPNMVQYTTPAKGGHFAAWEVPDLVLADVESFVAKVASSVHS